MLFNEVKSGSRLTIDAYGDGGFRVSGERYSGSIVIVAGEIGDWPIEASGEADWEAFQQLVAHASKPEIILFGTGASGIPVSAGLRRKFEAAGVALEVMDTGAACRTFNLLVADNRAVAAALVAA